MTLFCMFVILMPINKCYRYVYHSGRGVCGLGLITNLLIHVVCYAIMYSLPSSSLQNRISALIPPDPPAQNEELKESISEVLDTVS